MGNQAASCTLPDGPAGKALQEMTGPQRIAIADRFWFDLLKVQLPGVEQAVFFDRHYGQPEVLDSLVRDAYFLQLVATNEHSGNFRTFLRFWARLLHYYRTSPRDAKPCTSATILSLSLLCRCLVKQFAETFSAPELLFQLEQAPYEPPGDGGERLGVDGALSVSYCGRRVSVRFPGVVCEDSIALVPGATAAAACLEPFCALVPEDAEMLRCTERCTLRAIAQGETFAVIDAAERVAELGAQELVVCPCGVPHARSSVLRGVFREIIDFLVSSSFGAVSGAVPSLLIDSDSEADGKQSARNLSISPQTMQLQAVLLEIVLAMSAVIAPRYGPLSKNDPAPTRSRADYSAPFLFAARERQASARASASRAAVKAFSSSSSSEVIGKEKGTEVCICGRSFSPRDSHCRKCGGARASEAVVATSPETLKQNRGPAVSFEENEAPPPSVAYPPAAWELPSLPFLTAVLQVLEEEEDGVDDAPSADGDTGGAYGVRSGSGCETQDTAGGCSMRGDLCQSGARAEAFLASLINVVWLEPHAASLPRPPKEVVRLLTGVALPFNGASQAFDDAATEVLPAAADEKAAGRAAMSAGGRLATRALVVLLLVLFQDSQAHPSISRAFAALADPLLDVDGKVAHTAAAAPLNFTQLLRVILARLSEGLYDLLLYCLIHRNFRFRSYCLCRADADEVLVPILTVLQNLPSAVEGMTLAAPPASSMALVLTLLALTNDRNFCEGASRTRVKDGGKVLGKTRPIRDICVSSLLVAVLLRLGHWNFGACRSVFFNQALAGILSNLARHGIEQLHWYAASRLLEMAQLLARNILKAAAASEESECVPLEVAAADQRRLEMVRELLRALTRLISGCLRVPLVARNCSLVYALQRVYPPQFNELEADGDLGPPLCHTRAVLDWFQVQCPPDDEEDGDGQIGRLEAAAPRLPGAVDALAGKGASSAGIFAYAESAHSCAYFLPVVWRAARQLLPDHVCWSRPSLCFRAASPAPS